MLQEVYAERIVLVKGDERIVAGQSDDRNKQQAAGTAAPAAAPGGPLRTPVYIPRPSPRSRPLPP
ncbi:MAG: hypothetical protein ACM33C_04840 [Syntrophaceae bacterium]